MLIDWFTVAAQIVNFLVLVWLLKHFLYGRIINAIRNRESRITTRMAEAEEKQKAAAEQLSLYQAKTADLEKQREAWLSEARAAAEKLQSDLVERARAHVQELETKWRLDLERERETFLLDLRTRAAAEIIAIARRTIADLACLDVEECAVRTFMEKLRHLDHNALASLGSGDLLVLSASELPEDTRAEIREMLEDGLATPIRLQFEHAPELGIGVELRGNGRRIGWNAQIYLDSLEQDLKEALQCSHAEAS